MGISSPELSAVIRLKQAGAFLESPSVMEIGAQQLSAELLNNLPLLENLCFTFGIKISDIHELYKNGTRNAEASHLEAPAARDAWLRLGFKYSSIDVDGSPGAIPLDLNYDDCPANMKSKFDLVTNCGTTEHIANQLNSFKIIHEVCAVGGYMIHHVPSAGYYNHGLVNYNPKFFWTLARSNAYSVIDFNYRLEDGAPTGKNDLAEFIEQYRPDSAKRFRQQYVGGDGYIIIVMRKLYDFDFVPPIDVPDGTVASDQLAERYWTVFRPSRLREMISKFSKSD